MSKRTLLLLLAGGILIFTVLLIRSRLNEPLNPTVPMQATRVVVAKRDLAVGSFVQGLQDLDWGSVPDVAPAVNPANPPAAADGGNQAPEGQAAANVVIKENYLYEGSVKLTDFNGAVVRRALHAGEPVPQFAIMKSGEGGFMSAVLEPGMRAVSIAVNATSGNAGFVSPGDRVDLIVTHRVKVPQVSGSNSNDEFVASETFVRDVRVVAVDQMLDNPDNKAILAKTLTVEVNPHQAEEVAVAADLGKISIALRSLSNPNGKVKTDGMHTPFEAAVQVEDILNGPGATRDSDISALLVNRKGITAPRVHVIHGDKIENMDFEQEQK